MSIRIYALAKQLQVVSKDLVDICKQIGLEGKSSALASLTEEEVEQIKDAVKKMPASFKGHKDEASPMPMQKPSLSLHSGKIPVLKPDKIVKSSPLPEEDEKDAVVDRVISEPEVPSIVSTTVPGPNVSVVVPPVVTEPLRAEPAVTTPVEVPVIANPEVPTLTKPSGEKSIPSIPQLKPLGSIPTLKPTSSVKPTDSLESSDSVKPTDAVQPIESAPVISTPEPKVVVPQPPFVEETKPELPEMVAPPVVQVIEPEPVVEPVHVPEPVKPVEPTVPKSEPSIPKEQKPEPVQKPLPVNVPKQVPQTISGKKPQVQQQPQGNSARPPRRGQDNSGGDRQGGDRNGKRKPPLNVHRDDNRSRSDTGRQQNENLRPRGTALSSFEEAARQAALEEMRRPPVMTRPGEERIINLDQPSQRKKKEEMEASKTNKPGNNRQGPTIHLAPLPTAPNKTVSKKPKSENAQQPEARFASPEELLAAKARTQRPLSGIIKEGREKDKKDRETRRPNDSAAGRPPREPRDGKDTRGNRDTRDTRESKDRIPKDTRPKRTEPVFFDEPLPVAGKGKGSAKKGKSRADVDTHDETRERKTKLQENKRFQLRDDFDISDSRSVLHRHKNFTKNKNVVSTAPRKGDIVIEMPCTVKQFGEATGLSAAAVIKKLMELGYMLTINQSMDLETVQLLVEAFDLKATVKKERTLEEEFVDTVFEQVDTEDSLLPRPPVVTFLGHVDHGKTSLLDRILNLNVVSGEKGGITQHIRAYRIATPSGDVTFVDTPGHEAFTEMRARGANCTDIAVLVVAADDGVMPQTEEAISHARAADVPIVVALNKMDLPGANRDRVIQELAANDLMPSEWGGDVEIVETSALTGSGIDELMQTLLTIAELRELKANPNRPATGVALESSLLPGQGVVCKVLVQNGTLRPGDIVLCGNAYGRVKAMSDTLDDRKHLDEAGPSTPITLLGLDVAPSAGSKFVVLEDISTARQIAEERTKRVHETELADLETHVTLENLFERMSGDKSQQVLNIIIRADVRGSIEAIRKELGKLEHPEVKLKILQASVGGVTEADVHLADASDAIIVGFSVVPDEGARALAEKKKVQIRRYDIIYKLTEDIRAALEGMLKPVEQVKELGRAVVQKTFAISRIGTIAGCRVMAGTLERDCRVRLIRDHRIIGEYVLDTLKREKDDAREVREGYECGVKLKNYNDIKEGDVFEAYKIEEIARTF